MTRRTVLTWPNPRLRDVAEPIEVIDDAIRELVADMFETMYDEQGVGLAAIQIGVPLRVVVVDCGLDERAPLALLNPVITERTGSIHWAEGCLSIPGVRAEIERSDRISLTYQDEHGVERTREATGLLSVCIQHELDHLDGKMYFDRLGEFERRAVLNAYADACEGREVDAS